MAAEEGPRRRRERKPISWVTILFALGVGLFLAKRLAPPDKRDAGSFIERDEESGYAAQFVGSRLLESQRSAFQLVEVHESPFFGRMLTIDGALMITSRDEFVYHEMIAFVPLAYLPQRGLDVLVVGGGDGGTVARILADRRVERVVVVELDSVVVEMSRRHFPELTAAFDDPRVEVLHDDGARFVAQQLEANPHGQLFDCVIVDSTDFGQHAHPLFSDKFFVEARALLRPGGVVVLNLESPAWSLSVVAAVRRQLSAVFGHVAVYQAFVPTYLSGHYSFALCSDDVNVDTTPPAALALREPTRYYNRGVHRAAFALPEEVRVALDSHYEL